MSQKIKVRADKKGNVRAYSDKEEMSYIDHETGEKYKISYSQKLQLRIIGKLNKNNILQFITILSNVLLIILIIYALLSEGFVR